MVADGDKSWDFSSRLYMTAAARDSAGAVGPATLGLEYSSRLFLGFACISVA